MKSKPFSTMNMGHAVIQRTEFTMPYSYFSVVICFITYKNINNEIHFNKNKVRIISAAISVLKGPRDCKIIWGREGRITHKEAWHRTVIWH